MKKILAFALAIGMVTSMVACSSAETATTTTATAATETAAETTEVAEEATATTETTGETAEIGIVWYNFGDTFIANARTEFSDLVTADSNFNLTEADSQNDIATQTNNVNSLYTKGVDYMVVNNINTSGIADLILQAKEAGVTLIFANTDSPTDEEFELYENVYHVSSVATQSGTIIGEQLATYWEANPDADRNGNGEMDYIMLLGLQQHYDTQVRAQYSVEAIQEAGITATLLQESICNYQRSEAQNQVASILQASSGDIDAIIACNDDMALGAIEALKAAGFQGEGQDFIPVVGVDATALGVEALEDGSLLGTALNNPITLGNALYELIALLEAGETLSEDTITLDGVSVVDHHIYINYVGITAENTADAAY